MNKTLLIQSAVKGPGITITETILKLNDCCFVVDVMPNVKYFMQTLARVLTAVGSRRKSTKLSFPSHPCGLKEKTNGLVYIKIIKQKQKIQTAINDKQVHFRLLALDVYRKNVIGLLSFVVMVVQFKLQIFVIIIMQCNWQV